MILLPLLLALAAVDPVTDPIGPALEGQRQCYGPDTERRTCRALAGYTREPDGRLLNQAEVLIAREPPVIMHSVSEVVVRDGAICGRGGGVETATFTLLGRTLDEETTGNIRRVLTAEDRGETCTRYLDRGETLWADPVVDGEPVPGDRVIWVSPEDGYVVGP